MGSGAVERDEKEDCDEEYFFLNLFFCHLNFFISFREEEKCRIAFKKIMTLHPHLPGIVNACADYPDTLNNLIHLVSFQGFISAYMHY